MPIFGNQNNVDDVEKEDVDVSDEAAYIERRKKAVAKANVAAPSEKEE